MQLQFRIDDNNVITVDLQLQRASALGHEGRAEVIAAVVSDAKLSNLQADELLDLAGQAIDMLTTVQQQRPSSDWFTDEWLPATKANGSE